MDIHASNDRAWVVLVTEGVSVSHPPEIYASLARAVLESERWASIISSSGHEVERPFDGRWRIGDFDVRVVEIDWFPVDSPWIGTFWDRTGNPDPEAVLLDGRHDALSWVREPIASSAASPAVDEAPWSLSGSTVLRGEEVHAVAQLAKVVVG